jgi:hypothetical protein
MSDIVVSMAWISRVDENVRNVEATKMEKDNNWVNIVSAR